MITQSSLVIAAHIDDPLIGCPNLVFASTPGVEIVLTTDNQPESALYKAAYTFVPEGHTYTKRLQAEYDYLKNLSAITGLHFLNFPDARLSEFSEMLTDKIKEVLSSKAWRAIYIPACQRANLDHDATHKAARDALKDLRLNCPVFEYALYAKTTHGYNHNAFDDTDDQETLTKDVLEAKNYFLSRLMSKASDTHWFLNEDKQAVRRIL